MQKALSASEEPYRSVFINTIGHNIEKLKFQNFGVKLLNKLLITYPEFNQYLCTNNNFPNNKRQSGLSKGENFNQNVQDNYHNIKINPNMEFNNVNMRNIDYPNVNTNYEHSKISVSKMNNPNTNNNNNVRHKNNNIYFDPYGNFH